MIGYEELTDAAYRVRYELLGGIEEGHESLCSEFDAYPEDLWQFATDTAVAVGQGGGPLPAAPNTLVLLGLFIGMRTAATAHGE